MCRFLPDSKWGFLGVPPLLGALVGVGGVLLIILITGVVVAKHTWRPQPSTHVQTLIMTPTTTATTTTTTHIDPDTYDPDVVASLRHPAESLDVLPTSGSSQDTAPPPTLTTAEAAMHQGEQGQVPGRSHNSKQGSKHTSFSRGICLYRQVRRVRVGTSICCVLVVLLPISEEKALHVHVTFSLS